MANYYVGVPVRYIDNGCMRTHYPVYTPQGVRFCLAEDIVNAEHIAHIMSDPPESLDEYMADVASLEQNQIEWIQYARELERMLDELGHDYLSEGAVAPDEYEFPDVGLRATMALAGRP